MALKVKAKEQFMKVEITCYDKNGKEVKRVTSTSGEVEEENAKPNNPFKWRQWQH